MRKPILRLGIFLLAFLASLHSSFAFNIIEGEVIEFTGPDQLLLDPANAVVAVDFYGNADSEVEGVTFYTDRTGLGANVVSEGVVTVGTVTASIIANNQIDNWANSATGAAPAFSGGTGTSAANLGEIMRDIRFSGAPVNVTIDVEGLDPTTTYDIQMLFNEGQNTGNRRFDIGVEGALVVDDFSTHGGVFGSWAANNSFAYRGQFLPGADGILSIIQGRDPIPGDPNNEPHVITDNNSIIQAIIVTAIPATAPSDIQLSNSEFAAAIPIGAVVGTLSSEDVNLGETHTYTLVAGAGDTDNASFAIVGNELQVNADLSGGGAATYSIRIQSLDSGAQTFAKSFTLTATADSDGDGLPDNWETATAGNLTDLTGLANGPGPGAGSGDFDADGCSDLVELNNDTNPINADTDGDGSSDGQEKIAGTDPKDPDSDGDGLNDGDEATAGSDPLNPDSDGDSLSDGDEVAIGTDPTLPDTDGDGRNDDTDADPLDPAVISRTVVLSGKIIEFFGPDDLHLDPSAAVIAIDVYGNVDKLINGVNFQTDTQNAGVGSATNDGVTVTTTAPNNINDWAGLQTYTGADQASADNLEQVMRDIRWANNGLGQTLTVDIGGLDPSITYEIQLLVNEGGDRNRYWDVSVEGALVVDNFSSEGPEFTGVYSPNNGFAYVGEFAPSADGFLNILCAGNIGGNAAFPTDNNPILQGIVVTGLFPPTDLTLSTTALPNSLPVGALIGTFDSADRNSDDTHTYTLVAGAGDTDNGLFEISGSRLQGNADFTGLAGNSLSIRVRSTDSGGFTFEKEIQLSVSDDSDADTLLDTWEISTAGNLTDLTGLAAGPGPGAGTGDFDGDGSSDSNEFSNNTDPTNPDSDGDGSSDGDEATNGTDPNEADSDGDGLDDGEEATAGTDPLLADSDGDTLNDGDEVAAGTDPTNPDSDGDGLADNLDRCPLDSDPSCLSNTAILTGEIIEFSGPDDLHLDPATAIIAVNSFGTGDLEINGVTFLGDGPSTGGGTVTNGAFTVTTSAVNQIANWGAPGGGGVRATLTGNDPVSTDNLATVLESIRWNPAPGGINIDIAGLTPDAVYEVQLLTYEGRDRGGNRRNWDISVEDEFVVDNFTSSGIEGFHFWNPNSGVAYIGQFTAPGDGILNIVMQDDLGGNPTPAPPASDRNPILQGVIVHLAEPALPLDLTVVGIGDNLELSWNSKAGKLYDILSSTDPETDGDPATWPVFMPDLPSTPPINIETFARPADPQRFFVVAEKPAPPAFFDDLELDADGWTTGQNNAATGTDWEWGMPMVVGPFEGADFSVNCFGTNIDADYGFNTDSWLRTPPIDLTDPGITGARLKYQDWQDIEEGFAFAFVRVRRASDGVQLGADIFSGIGTSTFEWRKVSGVLPPEAIGEIVVIEFQFVTEDPGPFPFAGWYVDNVEVTLE